MEVDMLEAKKHWHKLYCTGERGCNGTLKGYNSRGIKINVCPVVSFQNMGFFTAFDLLESFGIKIINRKESEWQP